MDYFFRLIVTAVLLFFGVTGMAQQIPVYNHFVVNPYLFNPAEVATDNYMSLQFNHRQQWRGIEGAPVVSTLTFQLPFDYKSTRLGVMVRSFSRGLLTTQDVMFTYSYRIFLTKQSTLHFGISAGITTNGINMNEIDDPDDPVLADYLNNNMQPAGNAGLLLKSGSGLNLGVSLPKLFQSRFNFNENFQNTTFSPFDEIMFMGYYKKRFTEKRLVTRRVKGSLRRVNLEGTYAPLQFYLVYRYSQIVDERIEALVKLDLGQHMYIGGGYRLNYGMTGMVGFNIGNLSFGYAYEPATSQVSGYVNGTHEINLSLRFGKEKETGRVDPVIKTIEKADERSARFSSQDIDKGKDSQTGQINSKKKYYVVVKSFKDFNSADDLVRRLAEREIYTSIFFNKADDKYYVYTFETFKQKEANEQKEAVYKAVKYRSVKVLTIELE